jgi:hypothetical protein
MTQLPNPTNSLAADLQVAPETQVCFLWMYNNECLVSNPAKVWNDGHVAWEDTSAKVVGKPFLLQLDTYVFAYKMKLNQPLKLVQVCVLNSVSATSSEPQCQIVTGNNNEIIASTSISLHSIIENPQPRRLVLAMR